MKIEKFNMATIITQDEFEPELLHNPNLTMAIPKFAAIPVAKIPTKVFKQMIIRNDLKVAPPVTKQKSIKVQGHNRGSTKVKSHLRNNSKMTKTKMKGRQGSSDYAKVKDDCKESVELAHTLHSQYIKDLFNSFKK
jgi:hypothetical protein